MEKKIATVLLVAMVFLLGWYVGKRMERAKFPDITERTDTMVVTETIVRDSLIPVEVIKWKTVPEYLAVHDTTYLTDSILVDVPIEKRIYKEDSLYYAVVSGFKPSLDSLEIYKKTVYVEKVRNVTSYKPFSWTLSPFVSQEVGLSHYDAKVGVQAEFGRNRWRFIPEVGYRASSMEERGWYAGGRLKFDLIRK